MIWPAPCRSPEKSVGKVYGVSCDQKQGPRVTLYPLVGNRIPIFWRTQTKQNLENGACLRLAREWWPEWGSAITKRWAYYYRIPNQKARGGYAEFLMLASITFTRGYLSCRRS
jgi:hypothetical protein